MTAETGSYRWMAPEVRGWRNPIRLTPRARRPRPLDLSLELSAI